MKYRVWMQPEPVEIEVEANDKDEEMFTMGRMAEIDVVISELKNDLGIPIEEIEE